MASTASDGISACDLMLPLCGVRRDISFTIQVVMSQTPHYEIGHITHKMWLTTFDAGEPLVRFDEGELFIAMSVVL